MAHFAQLDSNNVVIQVLKIDNPDITNSEGNEVESLGIKICEEVLGVGTYVQCSYNHSFRYNYPSIGFTYDPTRDAFVPTDEFRPWPSWTLSQTTLKFEPPVEKPATDCYWDEKNLQWIKEQEQP